MCGIAGIYHFDSPPTAAIDRLAIASMLKQMEARGPDGEGTWSDAEHRITLGHRRLSIVDLDSRASQPMASACGRYQITFNGEIYNYQELRRELVEQGVEFRTQSDTEVILNLYAQKQEKVVDDLRGMFAFAIWDQEERSLFLARDHFGIKPLYYSNQDGTFTFASQVKTLENCSWIDTSYNPAGWVGFYLWGHVPDPFTIFQGVRSLASGSYLFVSEKETIERSYFSINDEISKLENSSSIHELSRNEAAERFHEAMFNSVEQHLIADVPVGAFLSAGRDSATLVALAKQSGKLPQTITLGFSEFRNSDHDETKHASEIAKSYGLPHMTAEISQEQFQESKQTILNAMDQPTIDGVNTFLVSQEANRLGMKVAFSGLGGDELLGGYSSFQRIPKLVSCSRLAKWLPGSRSLWNLLFPPVLSRFLGPKLGEVFHYGASIEAAHFLLRAFTMPQNLPSYLAPEEIESGLEQLQIMKRLKESTAGIKSDYLKLVALEMQWYMKNQLLRDSDWAGMANSLEIRVPLVDVELFRTSMRLAAANAAPTKGMLADTPDQPLPSSIANRKKTGFAIPVGMWTSQASHGNQLHSWARIVAGSFLN